MPLTAYNVPLAAVPCVHGHARWLYQPQEAALEVPLTFIHHSLIDYEFYPAGMRRKVKNIPPLRPHLTSTFRLWWWWAWWAVGVSCDQSSYLVTHAQYRSAITHFYSCTTHDIHVLPVKILLVERLATY